MGKEGCVGVFDSGVGGISVLRSMVAALPHEDFVFFGDSANAPYGEKSTDEVLRLSRANVERLLDGGAKAIVIACNTATSVAAARLRGDYPDLPIVGVEPALKPATLAPRHDRILVMAGSPGRIVAEHRVDTPLAERDESWVFTRTAEFIRWPDIRTAFALPELP